MTSVHRTGSTNSSYGQPMSGRLVLKEKGLLKARGSERYCVLTEDGKFVCHKGMDPSTPIQFMMLLKDILSVGSRDEDAESREFVVISAEQPVHFIAPSETDLEKWIRALNPPQQTSSQPGDANHCGWLTIKNKSKKQRWCVLRRSSMVYFKSKDDRDPCGAIPLDNLCTIVPPSGHQAGGEQGQRKRTGTLAKVVRPSMSGKDADRLTFTLHTALHEWKLTAETHADCMRWISAIQDAIECAPRMTTKYQKTVDEVISAQDGQARDSKFATNELLRSTTEMMDMPLTPLSYGVIGETPSGNRYGYAHIEALRVFESLLPGAKSRFGSPDQDERQWVYNVIQVCLDVAQLRTEIFAQTVKQVLGATDSPHTRSVWKLLAALVSTFQPSSRAAQFFHLAMSYIAKTEPCEFIRGAALYCLEALQKAKNNRPPPTEVFDAIFSGSAFADSRQRVVLAQQASVGFDDSSA